MKINPDLLQEAEVENTDAYLTSDASKINEDNDNINISMEEEQENVEYQKTLKVDIKNTTKNRKTVWKPVYEVIHASILKKRIFSESFLDFFKMI